MGADVLPAGYPDEINPASDVAQLVINPTTGGTLPITGAQTSLVAAEGAALLTIGAIGYVIAR